jgi:CRP-like cAMP-binding protein
MTTATEPRVSIFRFAEGQAFAAGNPIFKEGDPGGVMYIVKEGTVEVRVAGRLVATVGPGSILGEMSLLDGASRSAHAVARTDCQLVAVDEQHFQRLVQQTPYFALEVMRVMAHRLRHMNTLL